ncbi:MAG: hypothetical protein WA735_23000, partial [Candidatus Acidiferrales bacterium]
MARSGGRKFNGVRSGEGTVARPVETRREIPHCVRDDKHLIAEECRAYGARRSFGDVPGASA